MECGAPKRKSGDPCGAPAMANGRCRIHGGTTPVGMALPQFKHGLYSKYLPTNLFNLAQAMREDEELFSVRDDLATVTARIADIISDHADRDTPMSAETWEAIVGFIEQRRRLIDADTKRQNARAVPVERVMVLIATLVQSVHRHVTDPAQRDAVTRDVAALMGTQSAGRIPGVVHAIDASPT